MLELRGEGEEGFVAGDAEAAEEFSAVGGEHEEGREAADAEAFLEGVVGFALLVGEGFAAREVDEDGDDVGGGVFAPFLVGEDAFVGEFAPGAPVGAGEVQEEREIGGGGDGDGFVVVFDPLAGVGLGGGRRQVVVSGGWRWRAAA